MKKGKCVKLTRKIPIKIKCPPKKTRVTKCKNGVAKKIFIRYFIKKCECVHKKVVKTMKCPCPKSKTIRSPCVKGHQKVVTIFHVRFRTSCRPKKKIHEEICDKHTTWKPKYACQCYHYGRGNILTFDRRRLIANSDGKCTMLLSQWINKKSDCSYKLFAVTKSGKYVGQLIHFMNSQYLLTEKKKLFINGKATAIPFSAKKVRIFYSGEYLQFVVPKCTISIAYNGHGGGYLNVGVYKGHTFVGLCGNCNGNPIDDKLDKTQTGGRKCKPVSGMANLRKCLRKKTKEIGHKFCGRLAGMVQSDFLKCRSMSFHFFRGCIKDVCAEWPNKKKMHSAACKVHSLAAEACSEHKIFLFWRSPKFCPISCGDNKRFVGKMNPCPKTCENHFFGTSRRCFRLPHRNGCECKKGFVLDGNRCVEPTKCRCLDKVCMDRFSKTKCTKWMNEGRCTTFPEAMREFCRMTCKFCSVSCEDQISTNVCRKMKSKGKCSLDFYKQMCRLTCFPQSCKCPACELKESQCHPIYKYQIKKNVCYKLNNKGQCMPLVTRTYAVCGDCPSTVSHSRTNCDFCKGYRWSISISHFRDESIKKKCKSISSRVKEPCQCRIEHGSQIKCISDTKMVKIIYQYGVFKCKRCVKNTTTKIKKLTDCRGTWITTSRCNKKTGKKLVTFHKSIASNCKCNYSARKVEVLCKCPRFKKKGPVCENNAWAYYQVGYRMENKNRCKKTVTKSQKSVICNKKTKILIRCNKNTCQRTKYVEKWKAEQCQCRLNVQKMTGGRCCCPKSKLSQTPCLGYHILRKKIVNILINNECITRIFQQKLRCRCPKKKIFNYCDKRKGLLVKGITKYYLTKHHTCRKKTVQRKSPVLCRKVEMRQRTPCLFSKRHTKMKFRKITFKTLVKRRCKCVTKIRTYLEPCGCKDLKHKEVIPCPKKCKDQKHCPRNCFKIIKWFKYRYSKKGRAKKCIRSLLKVQRKKCCCPLIVKRKKSCIKGTYIRDDISKKVLANDKCVFSHQEVRHKVQCPMGFIRRINGPKMKSTKFLIKNMFGFVSKCKCKSKIKKKLCTWKCPPKVIKKVCNKMLKSMVTTVTYFVLRGCKCLPREKIETRKIFCPKYLTKMSSKCRKGSKYGVISYKKSFQIGCQCKSAKVHRKKLCDCPSGWITKPSCKRRALIKSKIYFRIHNQKCKRFHKIISSPVRCAKKVKIVPKCFVDSGIFVKYKVFFALKNCKCAKVKKIVQRGHCHCDHKKNKRSVECDNLINKWLHINVSYVLNHKSKICQRKVLITKRSVFCHREQTKRSKCNLVTKRRKILKIYYVVNDCQCKKRKKTILQKCGCPKVKAVSKTICDKRNGNLVTTVHYKKWKEVANKCIKVVKKMVKPIYCKRDIRIYKSKCNGDYYSEKIVKKYKNAKTCSCKRKIRQVKQSCHCPTKVVVKKCDKSNDYLGRKILLFQIWNSKTKTCSVSNRKVYYRRCKCPKSFDQKFCIKGKVVKKSTVFKLEKHRCIKILKSKKYEVFCKRSPKKIIGKCDRKSCTKSLTVFERVNDPKSCTCVWRKISSRKCKCCGCPKKTSSIKCYKNQYYRTKILYFVGKEGKCSYKCHPKQKTIINILKCHIELPKPHWRMCDQSNCKKKMIAWKLLIKNCKCIKRKYISKIKTCCCKHKTKTSKFCKKGEIISLIKNVRLRNVKCVPVYKRNTRRIKCKRSFRKISRKCDRRTCSQSIFGESVTVHPHHCKCTKKVSFLYKQPCCCKKKSYTKIRCDGKCTITTKVKYLFNKSSKSCIQKIEVKKKCRKCPKKQGISGRCNKKFCLRFKYHTQYHIKNCQCIKQVTKTGKLCCCQKPTPWSKICRKHEFIFKQLFFKLHHDKCVKNIRIRKRVIKCSKKKQKTPFKCNRKTCLQNIRFVTQKQFGCRCVKTKRDHYRKCCCPATVHKKTCKNDKHVFNNSKSWYLRQNKCLSKSRASLAQTVDQCKHRKWVGSCNKKSKTRVLKIINYGPRKCKCVPVRRILKHLLCACPSPIKRISKCDLKTCRKSSTFIYFIGPIKHKKCIRKYRKNSWKCCCLGKKTWTQKRCNKYSGNIEMFVFKKTFDKKLRSCHTSHKRTTIVSNCPKKRLNKTGKCRTFDGMQLKYSIGWKKNHDKCSCSKKTVVTKRLCTCKHKKCQMFKPKCVHHKYLQKKKICYIKKGSKCSPEVQILRREIECSHKKMVVKKCSRKSCKGYHVTKWFVNKDCKCEQRTKVSQFICCCPKSKKTIKCKHDVHEIKSIRYRYNKIGKYCKQMIIKSIKPIHCKLKRTKTIKCNKKTCQRTKVNKYYKIVDCKCKLVKIQKLKQKCCCPKKKNELKCYKKYGVVQHVLYNHRLSKGTCVVQKLVEQDKIACGPTKFIRSKCEKLTKKRTIKIISYKRFGCKCKRSIRTIMTLCACKKPRILKGECKKGRQSVFQIEYRLEKIGSSNKCVKTVIKLYSDPCKCRATTVRKKCKYNQIQLRIIQYTLKHSKHRKFCHMQDDIKFRNIKCPKKRQIKTKCIQFVYKVITIFYRLKHCKCVKQKKVKQQACQCPNRNKHYSYCNDGVIFTVSERYYSSKGVNHCLMHSVYGSKSIKCRKNKMVTPLTKKCNIMKGYSFYETYLITWNKLDGCKCVKMSKKVTKLCKCAKNVKKVRCIADDTLKIYRMTVVRTGKHCLPKQEITTQDIQCTGKERDIRKYACERIGKNRCFQKIMITEKWVENCKCKKKSFVVKRRCCVPKPILVKYCDVKNGLSVTKTDIFKLTPGKILYHKDDFLIQEKKLAKSTVYQRQETICPAINIKEQCHKETGKWLRRITSYKRIGCACKMFVKNMRGKCKCPMNRDVVSKCKTEFQTVRSVNYKLIGRHCVRFSQIRRHRCSCPDPISRIYCDGDGRWVKCLTEFTFNKMSLTCNLEKRCVRWDQVCPEPHNVDGKCNKETFKRRIHEISFFMNEEKCTCQKSVQYTHEFCSCDHLNRLSTKCVDGLTVTRKIVHSLSQGQCIPTRIRTKKKIHCPGSKKRVSKCDRSKLSKRAGYRLVTNIVFSNTDCHCKKKVSKRYEPCDCKLLHRPVKKRFCKNGDSIMTQRTSWTLVKHKCSRKIKYYKKDIVCPDDTKKKTGKCTRSPRSKIWYKMSTIYRQKVNECKCVWIVKQRLKTVCKCPIRRKVKRCLKNRIVERELEFFTKDKYSKKCVLHKRSKQEKIQCPKRWKHTQCKKVTCTLLIWNYSQISRNCKCQTIKSIKKAKCCCPKPSRKKTVCDKKKSTLISTWYTFKLMNKACIRKRRHTSYRIRCERREPKVRMGKCVKHYRTVYIVHKQSRGCRCINVVKKMRNKCGCPKKIKFHKGKCAGKFTIDSWSALHFVQKSKKCSRKVIQKRLRRCKCPKKVATIKCVKDQYLVESHSTFVLQPHTNSCQKMVSAFKHNIGCSTKPKLVKTWKSKCSKETGFHLTIKKTYEIAKKCKCLKFEKSTTWPCDCEKLHPSTRQIRCTKNKFLIKSMKMSYRRDKKCLSKILKQTNTIKCHGTRRKVGQCSKTTGHKTVRVYKMKTVDCKCHWALHKSLNVLCKCPKSTVKIKCVKDNMFVRSRIVHYLRKNKCIAQHSQVNTPIACKIGIKVTRSKCDSFTGFKFIKMITKSIRKCHCNVHSSLKRCRCRCPKRTKHTICEQRTGYIKTVVVTSQLHKCKCLGKRHLTVLKVSCPKTVTRFTKCRSTSTSKDKYKSIIEISHHRDGCKCIKIVKKKRILCDCNPRIKKIKKCVKNKHKALIVTKRIKINGKCKRVEVDDDKTTIVCPPNKTKKQCDKRSGVENVHLLRWSIRGCKCSARKYVKKLKCKCNRQRKLVRVIKCNKQCQSVNIYKYEILKDKRCKYKYVARKTACCCPKWKKKSSKCLSQIGMIKTTLKYLELRSRKCVEKISSRRHVIHCPKKKVKRSEKLPKGIIKITLSEHRRIGCKCKLFKSVKYERWNCPKNRKTRKCVNVPESSMETLTMSYRMMSKTIGCKKLVVINRVPTECPPDRTYWTKCIPGKHAHYKMLIQISYVAKNCKCKKSIEKTATLCKCDKPTIKRFCKKSKGLRVQILTTFVPDSHNHKHCVPVQTKQEFKILCPSEFKFNHKSKCSKRTSMLYIISKSEKREGCECKKKWRSKPCVCKCPKTKITNRCRIDNVREKIVISYVLLKCSCKKLVSSHLLTIKCPMKTRSYHRCGGKRGKCISELVTTSYKPQRCQCKKREKITLRKCCCPKSRKLKKCIKGSWVVVYVSYKLNRSRCYRLSHHTSKKTHCSSGRTVKMVGPCLGSKQKYMITTFVRKGCRCFKKKKFIFRSCLCLKKSAAEIVFLVDQAVSSRFSGYQKMIQNLLARTVSMFPLGKHSYQFALIKYSETPSIVFNLNDNRKHETMFRNIKNIPYIGKRSNLAKALHLARTKILKHSRPGILRLIYIVSDGVNDNTSNSANREIKLLKRSHIKVHAVAVKPSKNGLRFLKKLLTNSKSLLMTVQSKKHVRDLPYQILRTICKKACPIGHIKRSKCSRATNCRGLTYVYGFKTLGKQCLRTITKRSWKCCCPKTSKVYNLCLKNRKILVKTSWIFVKKSCEKSTKKRDISSKIIEGCRPKVVRQSGPCKKSNHRTILTIKRIIRNCKCVKLTRKTKVLCRCSRSKRLQICKNQQNLVNIKLYQTLSKDKCIKRRNMSKLPIVCPKSRVEKSHCDRITCKRKIQIIKFAVKQCKCHHQLTTIKEKCCCPRNKETSRRCHKNRRIYHTTWNTFNNKLKTCVKKSIRKSVKLGCSKKVIVKIGKCNIPYGKVWYKLKRVKWRLMKDCKCIKMVKNSKVPCKCSKGKSFKKCSDGGIWKMYNVKYELVKIKRGKQIVGKCKRVLKIVWQKKHECKKHHKTVYSKCKVVNNSGNKYRIVETSTRYRKGCSCARTTKRYKELCKCPKGTIVKKCIKDKYKVAFHSWFAILGHGKNSRCLLKTRKSSRKIKCPKPLISKTKCSSKSQTHYVIKTLLYVTRNCKCTRKTYVRKIKCDPTSSGQSHNGACMDLMSRSACEKLKLEGACKKPGVHRDKVCMKTCSRCSRCPENTKIGFEIKYHSCLVADRRYKNRFKLGLLARSSYHDCMIKCKSLSSCKSFDFYIARTKGLGHCVLNKVNPKQLEISLYPRPMKLGASYKDLQKHHAKHCIISIKQCKKKCPLPKLKRLGKCKCSKVRANLHCYRKAIIYHYITTHTGRCLKRAWKGLVPCARDACNDWASDRKCRTLKEKGKCTNRLVKKLCQKTCSKCHCSRKKSYTTKCDKTNHKFRVSLITAKHQEHRKCVIYVTKEKRSCNVCYKKSFRVVHRCKHSVRSITSVKSVKLTNGACKVVSNSKYYSCSKCPRNDQYFVTSCINGHLKLITKYSIRQKGCCKFKIDSRTFLCAKCPQKQVRTTRCTEGYRLRHVYYHVRANVIHSGKHRSAKCIKRVYTKKEKCNSVRVCLDEMSSVDCQLFKKSNGCRQKEADALRLCKATCGLC